MHCWRPTCRPPPGTHWRRWTSSSTSCASSRSSRVWAMAVWVGWRRASWTRWPRWPSRRSATASATSTASSSRQFNEEGRQVEVPDSWLRHGNPWEFPHPEMSVKVGFGGTVTHNGNGARRPLDPGGHDRRRAVQLHGSRLPLRRGQHSAAVAGPGRGEPGPQGVQLRGLPGRRCARRPRPSRSPRSCTPRTRPRRASGCACSSSTSSSLRRSTTSSTTCCRATSTCGACTSGWSSSSTTPTR